MSAIESVLRNLESMDGPGKDIEAARLELAALRADYAYWTAENERLREALGRIVRCVHGTEIVRDTLPAGYGVSSDEVGSPGPWYGLRLESGEERGWSRSYFKMRLADVGAYEPDADFLASIARAALAEKEDRRG